MLLEKWMKDPIECCQAAGVQAPSSVLHHGSSLESNTSPDISEDKSSNPEVVVEAIFPVNSRLFTLFYFSARFA